MPKVMSYKAGSIIFFAGDKDERIFILQTGDVVLLAVDIVTGLEVKENVKKGEFFGVKNSLVKAPRTDTARAVTDCQVVMLTVQEFEKSFSGNKDVMLKMMTNFSRTLRSLHYSVETLLKKTDSSGTREEGMYAIAKAFFDTQRYNSAVFECEKILHDIPELVHKDAIQQLLESARVKAVSEEERNLYTRPTGHVADETETRALKQFSLPIFDRFTKKYNSGEIILSEFTKAKSFYFVKSGEIFIEKLINGSMKRFGVLRPGDIFGEMELLEESTRQTTAVAKGDVSCLKFNRENFNAVIVNNAAIVMNMLRQICRRVFEQRRDLEILCIKDLGARLADIFLVFVERQNAVGADEDDMKRTINVTLEDIAQVACLSVNDARDELNKYVSRNKIAMYDDHIVIQNIMDMKRTVDSYHSNKEDAEKKDAK